MFPSIKYSKLETKNAFGNNYFGSQSFFMSYHFARIFVHLLTILAVFKLIEWDPAKTYLFKVNKNDRKRCELYSNLTINTIERRSGYFAVNFEHISHIFLVLLLLTMNR